jgi:hypothetical protein
MSLRVSSPCSLIETVAEGIEGYFLFEFFEVPLSKVRWKALSPKIGANLRGEIFY